LEFGYIFVHKDAFLSRTRHGKADSTETALWDPQTSPTPTPVDIERVEVSGIQRAARPDGQATNHCPAVDMTVTSDQTTNRPLTNDCPTADTPAANGPVMSCANFSVVAEGMVGNHPRYGFLQRICFLFRGYPRTANGLVGEGPRNRYGITQDCAFYFVVIQQTAQHQQRAPR